MDKFVFLGFPPHKKGRQKFFKELANYKYPVIIYESPYRIIKTLRELKIVGEFDIVLGRELTKKFETIYRGKIDKIINQLEKEGPKGEFVIVVRNLPAGRQEI
jgi:16S rRNA (cytidine1402-2'-O)-methyltransferase